MEHKSRIVFWIILVLANMGIAALAALWIFGGRDLSVEQKEDARLIGLSYMTMNIEFYKIMSEEINDRIEAEGDQMVMRDPALDADRQIEQIRQMLDMGIDALVVTPVDSEKLAEVLEAAKEQGVYIIVLDTNVDGEDLADCTITSDNYEAGVIVGEYFLEKNPEAKVVVMTHEATQSGRDRVQGFLDTVASNDKIEIVKKIECQGQVEIAMPKLQEAIDEGVGFDNVFCLNDLASVGVVAALEEDDMLDQVGVYGVDGSPDAKALIQEGMMEATAAQFPSQIGRQAAEVIYQLLNGGKPQKSIQIPVELITPDNVSDYGTERWQ